jgi:hypothetical protein
MIPTTRERKAKSDESGSSRAVLQPAHALEPHAGIEELPDDRSGATVTEVLARTRSKQAPDQKAQSSV